MEISEIDGRLAQQYEAKLQLSLQELRDQQDAHARANREELEARYDNKVLVYFKRLLIFLRKTNYNIFLSYSFS